MRPCPPLCLLLLTLFWWPQPLWSYEPPLADIYQRILSRTPKVSRAIIRTRSRIYQALPERFPEGAGPVPGDAPPVARQEREFWQTIYWIRHRVLAVETFSGSGELLNLMLDEGFAPVLVNTDSARVFSRLDIVPPYLAFVQGTREDWTAGLRLWGVQPSGYDLVRSGKDSFFIRLQEGPGKSVWVEQEGLRPVKIKTLVDDPERPFALTIEFVDFLHVGGHNAEEKNLHYPRTTNYLVDGRLFRQTNVISLQADPRLAKFPLRRLRALGRELSAGNGDTRADEGVQ